VVPPETGGPQVRTGFLWFFLALAAVTSGRWWTAVLTSLVAAAAAYQVARVWSDATVEATGSADSTDDAERPTRRIGAVLMLVAALAAASVPLAAGYGTGTAGAAFLGLAVVVGLLWSTGGGVVAGATAVATVPASLAAGSIVLALQVDVWAALFLVLTVSLYDAGNFLLGSEAAGRWEGPIAGVLGALAVTFTMATIGVPPFDRAQWWVAGIAVAATCAAGQWATSYLLPQPTSWAPAMRRLDAYVVAGPVLVAVTWALGT
jgi:hypothetical protein